MAILNSEPPSSGRPSIMCPVRLGFANQNLARSRDVFSCLEEGVGFFQYKNSQIDI